MSNLLVGRSLSLAIKYCTKCNISSVRIKEINAMKNESIQNEGIREKKRREVYRRITEVGLKLFAENGFEATTLDEIAKASGIARRTFFHYFSSKEEIILAWQKALPDELYSKMLEQEPHSMPIATIKTALISLAANIRPDIAVLIGTIVQSSEQLQLGNQAKFVQMEYVAYRALCEIWHDTTRRDELRLIAMIGIGAMRLSIDAWVADGCLKSLKEHLETYFSCLKIELFTL
jgi:AcrR family transcriptional regulator